MSRAYPIVQDGEWFRPMRRLKLMCCDCCLVHRVEFRTVKGCLLMRLTRHQRATTTARAARRIHVRTGAPR